MKSTSDIKPNEYTFERYPLGGYILWLRENFREIAEPDETGEPHTSWIYDEYAMLFSSELSNNFIERHFEDYLVEAKRDETMKTDKRLTSLEGAVNDLAKLIGGVVG